MVKVWRLYNVFMKCVWITIIFFLLFVLVSCNDIAIKNMNKKEKILDVEDHADSSYIKRNILERLVLEYMGNGMGDPILREIFAEDISDVDDAIQQGIALVPLSILYFDIDLNDDGRDDKIVFLESSLHHGSAGNPMCIVLNTEDGYVCDNLAFITRVASNLFCGDTVSGDNSICILNKKSDGFSIIEIISEY